MCLRLKSEKTRIQTAKKDIVVYKALNVNTKINPERLSEVKHGDSFTGIIKGIECEGKISFDEYGDILFCTDNEILRGRFTDDRLGYKYSWCFDSDVNKIIINGKIMYYTETNGYKTPYKEAIVEIGETYTSELEKTGDTIEKGLHTFKTMKDAKYLSHIVTKCIIPKGSKYYKGMCGIDVSYASDCLTYVEIVK